MGLSEQHWGYSQDRASASSPGTIAPRRPFGNCHQSGPCGDCPGAISSGPPARRACRSREPRQACREHYSKFFRTQRLAEVVSLSLFTLLRLEKPELFARFHFISRESLASWKTMTAPVTCPVRSCIGAAESSIAISTPSRRTSTQSLASFSSCSA